MPLQKRNTQSLMRLCGVLFVASSLAATAGCSLNPFADEGEASPAPVTPSAGAQSSGPVSLEPRRAGQPETVERRAEPAPPPQEVPLAPNAPERYVVKKGDTLWDISGMFLRDPWFWPEIWQVNPQVENPHLIYPGDVLSLVYIDGRPRILLERGIQAERLSPQIRATPLDQAITTIPYEQIAAFLTRGAVLEKDEADALPYILTSRGDHLIAGAGNDVYVRGDIEGVGSRYSVLHVDEPLVDPDDDKVVGYQAIYVGQGQVDRSGDPSTVHLLKTSREALAGDRLMRQEIEIPLNFFPKPPETDIDGRIISVVDGISLIGQYQVIVINRGARNGLAPGDVLSVLTAGETVRDRFAKTGGFGLLGGEKVQLPDEPAGTVMVFKVYDRIAYALVMMAESEMRVHDIVRNPS